MNVVFDTGSIITLSMNSILWALKELKENFKGEFHIPESVRYELVDKPMKTRRFKLQAIMINRLIQDKVFKVHSSIDIKGLDGLVNSMFSSKGKKITILQKGEIEALALVFRLNAEAYVVDERTMRMLIEDVNGLKGLLERKLHCSIVVDSSKVNEFKKMVSSVKVIRSTELMMVAFEKGMFDGFVKGVSKKEFVDGLLWGLRLRGAAISTEEINRLVRSV